MLSGLTSSSPTIQATISTAQPTSPTRLGRLRGLSYLRHYNNRLDSDRHSDSPSREEDSSSGSNNSPGGRRVASSATVRSPAEDRPTSIVSPASVVSRTRSASGAQAQQPSGASRASTAGWLPSVDGSSGPPQPTIQLQPSPITSRRNRRTSNRPRDETATISPPMARHRAVTTPNHVSSQTLPTEAASARSQLSRRVNSGTPAISSEDTRTNQSTSTTPARQGQTTSTDPTRSNQPQLPLSQLPSIRLVPYQDPRSPRPSLSFQTTTRTLPNANSIIRVGRYSEKDTAPADNSGDTVSDAPIGFKSKVVSRRHCEFFYENSQWFIKDVKSSSGTFLNRVRLSGPGQESAPFAVKDGDLVQLGIDFKGGEESIFRCVKIRVLCNRGWQKHMNKFNKSAHKRLNDLQRSTSDAAADPTSQASTECTICLNQVAPCQSLFVAPCSHTWHYKCIRPMLDEVKSSFSRETLFTCPNCRNVADLEADVDEIPAWDESEDEEAVIKNGQAEGGAAAAEEASQIQDDTKIEDETRIEADAEMEDEHVSQRETSLSMHEDDLTADLTALRLGNEDTSIGFGSVFPRDTSSSSSLNPGASDFVPSTGTIRISSASTTNTTPRSTLTPRPKIKTAISESTVSGAATAVESRSGSGIRGLSATPGSRGGGNGSGAVDIPASTNSRDRNLSSGTYMSDIDIDGLITPRNTVGPFVFDGTAGSRHDDREDDDEVEDEEGDNGRTYPRTRFR